MQRYNYVGEMQNKSKFIFISESKVRLTEHPIHASCLQQTALGLIVTDT